MMRLACVCSTGSSALLGRAAPPTGTPRPLKAPKNTYAHAISSTTDGFTRCTRQPPEAQACREISMCCALVVTVIQLALL